jgi:lysophospholipase L1-like esterase
LILPEKNILEAFRPKGVLFGLDEENPKVLEGIRITLELLKEMNDICQENHIQFEVIVIPTKETVFSEYLEHNSKVPLDDVIDKVIVNERLARSQLFKFMTENHIAYVDPLSALQSSVGQRLYAYTAADMHPSKNGYRVIAEAVAEHLKQDEQGKQPSASAR